MKHKMRHITKSTPTRRSLRAIYTHLYSSTQSQRGGTGADLGRFGLLACARGCPGAEQAVPARHRLGSSRGALTNSSGLVGAALTQLCGQRSVRRSRARAGVCLSPKLLRQGRRQERAWDSGLHLSSRWLRAEVPNPAPNPSD